MGSKRSLITTRSRSSRYGGRTRRNASYFDFFQYAIDVMGFSWDAIKDVEHEFKLSQLSPEERVKAEAAEKRLARMTRAFAREKDENRVSPVPLEPEAYRAMFAEEVPSEITIRQMNWWGWLHDIGEGKTEATFEEWLAGNGRGGAGAGKEGVEKGTEGTGGGGSPGGPPDASGDSTKR